MYNCTTVYIYLSVSFSLSLSIYTSLKHCFTWIVGSFFSQNSSTPETTMHFTTFSDLQVDEGLGSLLEIYVSTTNLVGWIC